MFPPVGILYQVEWNKEACGINRHYTRIHRWFNAEGGWILKFPNFNVLRILFSYQTQF